MIDPNLHTLTQILTYIPHRIQWYLKTLMFTKITFHNQTCVSKSLPITSNLLCLTWGNKIKKKVLEMALKVIFGKTYILYRVKKKSVTLSQQFKAINFNFICKVVLKTATDLWRSAWMDRKIFQDLPYFFNNSFMSTFVQQTFTSFFFPNI